MAGHHRTKKRCGARTRKGTPCRCKALANGRCRFHGGLSTGPRTAAGRRQSAKNLEKAREALARPEHAATRSRAAFKGWETRRRDEKRLLLEQFAAEGDPLALWMLGRM